MAAHGSNFLSTYGYREIILRNAIDRLTSVYLLNIIKVYKCQPIVFVCKLNKMLEMEVPHAEKK